MSYLMIKLGDVVKRIRSKNAGPFWITVDIFCGDLKVFNLVRNTITTSMVLQLTKVPAKALKRFELEDLRVVKFSFHRQEIQGSRGDRDMHGAQIANLFLELDIKVFV